MDKRQFRRFKSNVKKSENKINRLIILKVNELINDEKLKKEIESELKDLKTAEDFNEYIRNAHGFSRQKLKAG